MFTRQLSHTAADAGGRIDIRLAEGGKSAEQALMRAARPGHRTARRGSLVLGDRIDETLLTQPHRRGTEADDDLAVLRAALPRTLQVSDEMRKLQTQPSEKTVTGLLGVGEMPQWVLR